MSDKAKETSLVLETVIETKGRKAYNLANLLILAETAGKLKFNCQCCKTISAPGSMRVSNRIHLKLGSAKVSVRVLDTRNFRGSEISSAVRGLIGSKQYIPVEVKLTPEQTGEQDQIGCRINFKQKFYDCSISAGSFKAWLMKLTEGIDTESAVEL